MSIYDFFIVKDRIYWAIVFGIKSQTDTSPLAKWGIELGSISKSVFIPEAPPISDIGK